MALGQQTRSDEQCLDVSKGIERNCVFEALKELYASFRIEEGRLC